MTDEQIIAESDLAAAEADLRRATASHKAASDGMIFANDWLNKAIRNEMEARYALRVITSKSEVHPCPTS